MNEVGEHNRVGWNREVEGGTNPWTIPVASEVIARAREGDWSVVLTPTKPVPREWFGEIAGLDVLCLASGGGQQGPVLAAAGANVTVFDASDAQLGQDRIVAEREGLELRTIQGFMHDLSVFDDESFDLIFHPVSNCFAPDIRPMWCECYRVLRPGGTLLVGFMNPIVWLFDEEAEDRGELVVRHTLPFADDASSGKQLLEFSHTLTEQIGGQLDAGFILVSMFEDTQPERASGQHFPTAIATRARRSA